MTLPSHLSTESGTSVLAVVSLLFGILAWICLPLVGALIAIVCGRLAIKEIESAESCTLSGSGMAKAGMLLARIQVVFVVLLVLVIALLHIRT